MAYFLEALINGISLGSLYAIIALGYSMVYGIAKMLNFAHGDVIMVGGYIVFIVLINMGMPAILAILAAMVVCVLLGITIEGLAYRPLRQATSLAVLITAIGVSYFLQNAAQLIWGANPKFFTIMNYGNIPVSLGSTRFNVSLGKLCSVGVSVVIMLGLSFFTGMTKMGKAMRAVSEDRGAAELMGINVNRTISLTFAIGSALAAVAGAMLVGVYGVELSPTTGAMPGIKAFTAAVFGGIGSIPGAMIGGILIGVIEILVGTFISTDLKDALTFAVLIIMLVVKPTGLLGKPIREKV